MKKHNKIIITTHQNLKEKEKKDDNDIEEWTTSRNGHALD